MFQLKELLFVTFLFLVITKVHPFDPSTVDPATKATWCNNQIASCTNICWDNGYDATTNFCQPDTLQYDCVCSNGVRPNATEYTQTIPYFTCTADQQACINKCNPTTPTCVSACNTGNCGATAPKAPKGPSTTVVQGNSSPSAPGTPGTPTPTKNPNTLLSAADIEHV
ncbi:unnamed protein product [Rhizophagus irregularis]|uniref:DUF7707 domain-containing protein n=1 Tax=Rhizophagus irregularis TaxID=588596 RepID=A0A915ZK32_9GLOM|nr:unnamed protein product [Rhizophagus irregularis]CAB4486767.1 unnamed protein product [Rhizophagus irregularis]CAB5377768.1 unnamed protein product [Rhizophagus irregularis]